MEFLGFMAMSIALLLLYWFLDRETSKRKQFETIAAMLRDRKPLGEQLTGLFMNAKKYDEFGIELEKA